MNDLPLLNSTVWMAEERISENEDRATKIMQSAEQRPKEKWTVLEISETQLNEDINNGNVIGREGRKTDSKKCPPKIIMSMGIRPLIWKKKLF